VRRIVAVYRGSTSGGYKAKWPDAIAEGINKHSEWQSKLIHGHNIDNTAEYSYAFNYQFENLSQLKKNSHILRRKLYEKHINDGKIFFMDGDILISYMHINPKNKELNDEMKETLQGLRYVRVPFTHVYEPKAKFFLEENWEDRWKKISENIGIKDLKPYTKTGDQILVVCNRGSEGYSGMGIPAYKFAIETIIELRKYTKRPIVIRLHRANANHRLRDIEQLQNFFNENKELCKDIKIQSKKTETGNYPELISEINKSYAVVTLASSAAGPAIIEGKPLFVKAKECFFYNWKSGDFSDIENPNLNINRDTFLQKYSYSHWNNIEMRDGIFWEHTKKYLW